MSKAKELLNLIENNPVAEVEYKGSKISVHGYGSKFYVTITKNGVYSPYWNSLDSFKTKELAIDTAKKYLD